MKYKDLCIDESISIREAIKQLDKSAKKILLVTENMKLKGVITDGDIRRWILKSGDLDENVVKIMSKSPVTLNKDNIQYASSIMKNKYIEAIPIINDDNDVVDIIFWNDKFEYKLNHCEDVINSKVVIMAGGKGTRLYPYTKVLPKPLIPIGDIPIVERIINRFVEHGCSNFYLSINHKKNMIKAYFNELDKNYNVSYIEEDKALGTAGSLYMLKDIIKETFFVSNCDVLIDANYSDILKYHKENNNKITVVTTLKNYTISYSIINLCENGDIDSLSEKPEYNFLINTGMYILEPDVLNDIPKDEFFHITTLIENYLKEGKKVGTYPITDNAWLDMGEIKEMEKMIERLGL